MALKPNFFRDEATEDNTTVCCTSTRELSSFGSRRW